MFLVPSYSPYLGALSLSPEDAHRHDDGNQSETSSMGAVRQRANNRIQDGTVLGWIYARVYGRHAQESEEISGISKMPE